MDVYNVLRHCARSDIIQQMLALDYGLDIALIALRALPLLFSFIFLVDFIISTFWVMK